jgi:hypothetical protein
MSSLAGALALSSLLPMLPANIAAAQQAPDMRISDVDVTEGGVATFTVQIRGNHPRISVDFATRDGTASAGTEYAAASGTLTIESNSDTGLINIQTAQDDVFESEMTFFVDLSNTLAHLVDSEGRARLVSDDPLPRRVGAPPRTPFFIQKPCVWTRSMCMWIPRRSWRAMLCQWLAPAGPR